MHKAVMPDPGELVVAEQRIISDISERMSGAEDQVTRAALCRLKEIFQRLSSELEALKSPNRTDNSPTDPAAIAGADDRR